MANITDKITDVRNAARPVSARVTVARSTAGTTLTCNTLTGWPTASKVHFVTYQIDTNSDPIGGTQLDCSGIVSANTITQLSVLDGTDAGNSIGDVVEMLPTASWGQDLADALSVGHTRTGAHSSSLPLTSPVLTTPLISDFTSATHTHATAAQGGQIANAGISGVGTEKLANPYKFHVYRTAATTSSSSGGAVPFDTKVFDTGSNVDIVTNKGRFTAPVAGFYWFSARASNSAAVNTLMLMYLQVNGVTALYGTSMDPSQVAGSDQGVTVSGLLQLAANDYVEANFLGGNGSVISVGNKFVNYFQGFLVSTT